MSDLWYVQSSAADARREQKRQQKERVGTTLWYVLRLKDGVKDDEESKRMLLDGVNEFTALFETRKAGMNGDEIFFYSYHETQTSFTSNITKCTQIIFEKMFPFADTINVIITTWPEEVEFWKNISAWVPDLNDQLHVLITYNEREDKNMLLDLPLPTIEELTEGDAGSLSVEMAEQILTTMKNSSKDHQPVKAEESVIHVVMKVKDGIMDDPVKKSEMERLMKEFARRAQVATGTLACSFGFSHSQQQYHILIQYDSLASFHINVGWCGSIASKLNQDFVTLEKYEGLCGGKDSAEFFTKIGKEYKPNKLLVMEYGKM